MGSECTWCKCHEVASEDFEEWLETCQGYCYKHNEIVDSLSYTCDCFIRKENINV